MTTAYTSQHFVLYDDAEVTVERDEDTLRLAIGRHRVVISGHPDLIDRLAERIHDAAPVQPVGPDAPHPSTQEDL